MPIKMLATDYFEHNRNDNYVAWDYGYNLLNSCEPNGIIFTNGDNDTFPLWYLQEVENLRRDVKVVNLSLLNTPWYIDQLMNQDPKLKFDFSKESFSEDIYLLDPWYATESSFKLCSQEFNEQSWSSLECSLQVEDNIFNFNIRPTLIGRLLRVQDYMILKIIHDIGFDKPIYFAATVANNNQLGLEKYLVMEGMTYRLSKTANKNIDYEINYDKMKKNLTKSISNQIIYSPDDYNNAFLSDENTENIQSQIRYGVHQQTGKVISKQSPQEVNTVMRSIYLQEGSVPVTSDSEAREVISKLNTNVIDYCVNFVVSKLKQHDMYMKDISTLPIPLERPQYEKKNMTYDTSNLL